MPQQELPKHHASAAEKIAFGVFTVVAIAASLFLFLKKKRVRSRRPPGKKISIEIRYEMDKDAEAVFLAQNIVKVIRIVLSPLESRIQKEAAKLIFVFNGDSWEMRVRNGSEQLRNSVRKLLEATEW